MLKRDVPEACGLYFPGCRSIHTCMMRVPIDVVWVRESEPGKLKAVSLDVALKPWRFFGRPKSRARRRGNRRFRPQCRRLPV